MGGLERVSRHGPTADFMEGLMFKSSNSSSLGSRSSTDCDGREVVRLLAVGFGLSRKGSLLMVNIVRFIVL